MPVPATPIVSGVYKITNTANGKCYIGVSKNVNMRLEVHKRLLKYNCHPNKHLQHSYNKYGKDCFTFEVLEYCLIDELNDKERYYIELYDSLQNGYNKRHGGYDRFEWPDEIKRKISESHKGKSISFEHREKIRMKLKGYKHSEETKKKLSELRKGKNNPNYGGGFSEERRRNMSLAQLGKKHSKERIEAMRRARHPDKILTKEQEIEMYNLFKMGYKKVELAKMFKLNRNTVAKKIKEMERGA